MIIVLKTWTCKLLLLLKKAYIYLDKIIETPVKVSSEKIW